MINSLRKRFIILSMLALLVLMLSVVLVMNLVNYSSFVKESDDLLSLISDNRGAFPDFETGGHGKLPPGFTPDTMHQVRFFSVLVDKSGQAIDINTQNIYFIFQNNFNLSLSLNFGKLFHLCLTIREI